ncbi:MAG: hypothetical protein QM778_21460 [Myxococcales bacterium]
MRAQDWTLSLVVLAAGCSVIVDNKLEGKPLSATDVGDGDGDGDVGDGDVGDGDAGHNGSDAATGDGDMMAGDGGHVHDGGPPGSTRADVQVCLGATHGCRLFPDDELACWGNNDEFQTSLSGPGFKQVACGDYHTCALSNDGKISCAGRNQDGQRTAPSGMFLAVAAGDAHSCALKPDHTAQCWGKNSDGQASAPAGVAFTTLAAGGGFSCGIRMSDSKIQCWGSSASNRLKAPTDVTFKALDLGPDYGCGIAGDNSVRCWGSVSYAAPDVQGAIAIAAGSYACAVLDTKGATCWSPQPAVVLTNMYLNVAAGPNGFLLTPVTGEPEFHPMEEPAYGVPPIPFYEGL